ncbi:MAG: M28 family peptidase [Candidatus Aminicenantes bacterium]|nr:M28 family peptidase [Candidatus Aminicenantes bacterium]
MKHKRHKLFMLLSILVFLFFIHGLFPCSDETELTKIYKKSDSKTEIRSPIKRPLVSVETLSPRRELFSKSKIKNRFTRSDRTELIKIYKQRDASIDILYSPEVKIVQELRTCFIAHVKSGFSSNLSQAGFEFEHLDDDIKDKKYYLVYCPSSKELETLKYYGEVKLIEENSALFWSDNKEAREILPARFQIKRLPGDAIRSFKERSLVSAESFHPTITFPSRFVINPVISGIVNQVSKQNLTDYIQSLQDFQTRYASTSSCELAGDYIYDFFIQQGIDVEYDSFSFASSYSSNNIVGTVEGQVYPSQIVVICAHYDSDSDQPQTLAPGADDNASGTAAVMEAARIFANQSFDFTVKFICFSAEEWGLYGSEHYALEARQRGEDIIAVINLDMIAYTDSIPEDLDIISNPASEWLADRFFSTSITYTPLLNIFKMVNASVTYSDHSPFWDRGYSAILGIEDIPLSNPHYHTTNDTIDTLNLDFTTEVVKASLAIAADLAQPISTPQTPTGLTSRSQIISSLFSSIKTAFLNWDSNQDPVIGYNIYRTTTSHSDYQKLNSSPLVQTYYMDQNLDTETPHYYVLTAVDSLGNESNFSKEVADDEGNENTFTIEGRVPSRYVVRTILAIRKINPWI